MPFHALQLVRQLAADVFNCELFQPVLAELGKHGLDDDDLLYIIQFVLGERDWYKSEGTRQYHPGTVSDYYSVWVDECECGMFLKLLVREEEGGEKKLVITSFKRDDRYV